MTHDYDVLKKAHADLMRTCDRQEERMAIMEDCIRRLLYYTCPEDCDAAEAHAQRVLSGNTKIAASRTPGGLGVGKSARRADNLSATHSLRACLPEMPRDAKRQYRQFAPGVT